MKKNDLAMMILVAGISMMVSFVVAGYIPFLQLDRKGVSIKSMDRLSPDVVEPDPAIFNKDAINPTVKTVIGKKK